MMAALKNLALSLWRKVGAVTIPKAIRSFDRWDMTFLRMVGIPV